jgi:hypothetical protein
VVEEQADFEINIAGSGKRIQLVIFFKNQSKDKIIYFF